MSMKVIANTRYGVLLAELKKVKRPFQTWKGLLFRSSPLEYGRVSGRIIISLFGQYCMPIEVSY
jgi:hypothetical protein